MANETVTRLVCPHCANAVLVRAPADACPLCGEPLAASAAQAKNMDQAEPGFVMPTVDADAQGNVGPESLASDEQSLVADLREALGYDAANVASGRPAWLGGSSGSSVPPAGELGSATLPPGTRLGDYEILGELGRGGMGVVYRARQLSLGREVALKVLPGYARHGRRAVQRFRAEAQAAARLHHTNIVAIHAQGEHEGHFFYAMELVDGIGLDTVIHSRPDLLSSTRLRGSSAANWFAKKPTESPSVAPPPPPTDETAAAPPVQWTRDDYRHVALLFAEVADALECAHRNGVIHRDVKPHNLLLGSNDRLHLTDFGLARLTDAPHLTVSGEVMGTPAYLSPEQVSGNLDQIDHRTDIYSLGVTLYETLTQHKPFEGARPQILNAICHLEPWPLRRLNAGIPRDLETICLRAIEKDPARRQPTAAHLAEDLRRFADGRPILSRRIGYLGKAAKWIRRHKALTAAAAAIAGVLVLAAGLVWNLAQAQRRDAQRLVRSAYEQLAYIDYRAPGPAPSDLDNAARLGVAPLELPLVQALTALRDNDAPRAVRVLHAAAREHPSEPVVQYLLTWALVRAGDQPAARATLSDAEALRDSGAALTADAWFFRGLAFHWFDPPAAVESYRQAIALRARDYAFFPQAVLQLARARNQQLYAARCIDGLDEITGSLAQLIAQGHYKAYPYYLLSITHRLAGEVYAGSDGTREDMAVQHFAAALDWARRGRDLDPADERPITAEAECLESMGRYTEAIDARTAALALADTNPERCESRFFRWRLRYWTGDLTGALEDLRWHIDCEPENRFCTHVYPALLYAELGDLQMALQTARSIASKAPGDAQAVLLSATCLRLLGQPAEAQRLLDDRAGDVDFALGLVPPQSARWIRALYLRCQGADNWADLEALAAQSPTPWKLWGELYFHDALRQLAEGDRAAALESLWRAYRSFDGAIRYSYHARLLLVRLENDLAWPPWCEVTWREAPVAPAGHEGSGSFAPRRGGEEGGR